VYIDSPRGFCLGIPHMYISCFNQISPPHYLLFLYDQAPLLFNSLQLEVTSFPISSVIPLFSS
jgi:hypothetical protein